MTPGSTAEASAEGEDAGVPRSDPPTLKRVVIAFLPLAVFGLLVAIDFPLCPSKSLFGIPCPGCGLTRATEAMVVGDFWTMLRMHPLAPFLAPVTVFAVLRATLLSAGLVRRGVADPLGKIPSWFWAGFGVVLIGLWVARLFGFFGGHPDELDLGQGYIGQTLVFLWEQLFP